MGLQKLDTRFEPLPFDRTHPTGGEGLRGEVIGWRPRAGATKTLVDALPTLVEPGVDDRWIFSNGVVRWILALRDAVELVE